MNRPAVTRSLSLVAAILMVLPGCAALRLFTRHQKPKENRRAFFAVTAEKTPFYRYGPLQARGPDRELPRDTLLTVIRRSFGFSTVRLADGQQGFVASDDIARAPQRLIVQMDTEEPDRSSELPPPPPVKLPVADPSPEFEPTPLPQPLMPQ
jgi:hypothetical protein